MYAVHIGESDWISGIGVGSTVAFPKGVSYCFRNTAFDISAE